MPNHFIQCYCTQKRNYTIPTAYLRRTISDGSIWYSSIFQARVRGRISNADDESNFSVDVIARPTTAVIIAVLESF
ncbi:Restless-like transposase [Fusarium oxysporum f. sp. albedinis]|nr:Restless-like transposase [Fusarium oxysporum f. sp. albedinis]